MRHLLKAKLLVLSSVFLLFAILKVPELHRKFLINKVGSGVVRVVAVGNDQSGGTGFHLELPSGNVVIISNRHVCKGVMNPQGLVDIEKDGVLYTRQVIQINEDHDLCIIEPILDSGLSIGSAPDIGDSVFILGHPLLTPLRFEKGTYVGIDGILLCEVPTAYGCAQIASLEAYWLSAFIQPGNSGSPLVNRLGQVIGVIFAGSEGNFAFAVPLDYLEDFIFDK